MVAWEGGKERRREGEGDSQIPGTFVYYAVQSEEERE